jgi:hypothetical protein
MRFKYDDVLAGLKVHALGRGNALRSIQLANKLGLPKKVVSHALNWLAVEARPPKARRDRPTPGSQFEYWVDP